MKKRYYIYELYNEIKEWVLQKVNRREYTQYALIAKGNVYRRLLVSWKRISYYGTNIGDYLLRFDYSKVAIYAAGDIGKLCCDELIDKDGVTIECIIDKQASGEYKGIPIVNVSEICNYSIDAIIISLPCDYTEVADILCNETNAKLISLEDIVLILEEELE